MPNSDRAVEESIPLAEFFEEREFDRRLGRKTVKVAIKPMTEEQGRQAYPYRPRSKYSESYFGGDACEDDTCLLLNKMATRCKMCKAATKNGHLIKGVCPDCDGRSEYNEIDPHDPDPR